MSKNEISKVAKQIAKATITGSKRALNKAASKATTQMIRSLRTDTGLPTDRLKARVRAYKATDVKLMSSVNVATKRGVNLSDEAFKPKEVKLRVQPKNGKRSKRGKVKARTYFGVSVKIGKDPRGLVPGGFLRSVSSKKDLVLKRKGERKYPTEALKSDVVNRKAEARAKEIQDLLFKSFTERLDAEIAYALESKFGDEKD